jgi:hypothetical protein
MYSVLCTRYSCVGLSTIDAPPELNTFGVLSQKEKEKKLSLECQQCHRKRGPERGPWQPKPTYNNHLIYAFSNHTFDKHTISWGHSMARNNTTLITTTIRFFLFNLRPQNFFKYRVNQVQISTFKTYNEALL